MSIAFDDRPYWKPRDIAELVGVNASTVYRMIQKGDLDSVKVGGRVVRVPSEAVAKLVGAPRPDTEQPTQADEAQRVRRFTALAGRAPESFIHGWKSGAIEDTAENSALVIEALAIRDAHAQVAVGA
ncbi:excisionase family DNA-binding protein [Patulibacter sp. NPDC049589]|uniref:excisionase family DNA-binding protein n=1 Tax=Patulibacter sp. NPDC049589 TaxID=3154731 RepID=UPI00342D35E6